MDKEQIILDIKVEDKEIKQAEKSIDRLTDSIEELGNSIKDARALNNKYKKDQQELNKLYREGKITTEQYEKGINEINLKIKANNKSIAENSIELSKQKTERNANIKLINSEVGSLAQLEAKASILNKAITKQTTATKEGREEYERLEKELAVVNKDINDQRQAFNDNTKNIGNYKNSLIGITDGLDQIPGATSNAVGGIKSMGAAFKALLANPVVLVIAAIVAGLSALFNAFKKSESGSRLLSKGLAYLNGLMSVITKLADLLGDSLSSSFEEPQQAVEDLWNIIKQNLINRFKGLIELFISLGSVIKSALTGNLDELEQSAKDAGHALIQIGTGFDKEQQLQLADAMSEAAKQASIMADKFMQLEASQRANRSAVRFLEKDIAKLNAEFEMLGEIAGDDTRNMQEMRQAAIDAGKAASELANKQVSLASARLSIINQEVAVRKSAGEDIQDLLDEQAAAEVALTEAKSRAAIAQQKILIEQRKIERDIFEQNLDILIDVGDRIKTEQDKNIQNENLSLAKRRELLEASKAAVAANFEAIKHEYELYGITAEQINDVIAASDAKQANEKLKALGLNEIANNRLREIILEQKQVALDFNDLDKTLTDEEISRKQAANDKIQEINDEFATSQIKDAEKLRDALIEIEKRKLELKLEDETLLSEERKSLTAETEQAIREIELEYQEQKDEEDQERNERNLEILKDNFDEIISLTEKFAGAEASIFGKIAQSLTTAFADGKISASESFAAIGSIADSAFAGLAEKRANDLSNIEEKRKKELELAEGNEAAQAAVNRKYDALSAEIKLKQFKADKAKALIDIAIQTAIAVTKSIAASPLTGGLPWSAIVGALGAAQGAIVASKKPPKFGKGTSDIVQIGDSHASGNDVDVWGFSGNSKQYFGKVERGEAMPVIKKSAVNDYRISMLNGQFNPSNRMIFQNGTPDIVNQNQAQNNELFSSQLITAISNIEIIAKIEDITKAARKKVQIVDNSKV